MHAFLNSVIELQNCVRLNLRRKTSRNINYITSTNSTADVIEIFSVSHSRPHLSCVYYFGSKFEIDNVTKKFESSFKKENNINLCIGSTNSFLQLLNSFDTIACFLIFKKYAFASIYKISKYPFKR